jgi:putative ABC transport system permease protein
MLRNYLAAALRSFARNRLYAAINVIGLSVGFATALLIGLFVRHETTFDHFIPGYQNIYKLSHGLRLPGNEELPTEDVGTWMPMQLKLDVPRIDVARLSDLFQPVSLRHGDVEAIEKRFHWADPNIFDVLPLPAFAGNLKGALDRPDGLVLTRRMARRYFGTDDPIGETLEIDRTRVMTVMAVLQDLPSNTHLDTEIFGSAKAVDGPAGPFGDNARVYAYIQLKSGVTADEVRRAIVDAMDRNPRQPPTGKASDIHYYPLVPIADIHLNPTGAFAMTPGGDPRTIRAMGVVGVLVLLLASINFVNLKTARAARRAVEVGVRKVCGAGRRDLIVQFIGESLVYSTFAMLIAMVLVELALLPWLNAFLDRSIVFQYWRWPLLGYIVAAVIVVGTLAGVYPAIVLSSFRPAAVLKGTGSSVAGSGRVRQLLVVVQFAILIGLMLSTAIIYRQTQFGLDRGLRFDTDQLLIVDVPSADCEKSSFRTAVDNLPGVLGAACSEFFLGEFGTAQYIAPDGREVTLHDGIGGAGMFEMMGLKPVAGRFFMRDREADVFPPPKDRKPGVPFRVVVNETAAKVLGFKAPADAVGKFFRLPRSDVRFDIIGVVPDFSGDTVRQNIWPMYYANTAGWNSRLNVKLRGSAVPETLRAIDAIWSRIPGQTRPISRRFYDDYVQSIYASLIRQRTLFAGFALVALLLAGLGMFGLAGFTVERRTREIGVRKAMGANIGDVMRLLLWQFAKPVLWANLLAWPVAGYIMYRWLLGFAYRIDLEPWPFVASSLVALVIAMITVSTHSVLVARANAVAALRYE